MHASLCIEKTMPYIRSRIIARERKAAARQQQQQQVVAAASV